MIITLILIVVLLLIIFLSPGMTTGAVIGLSLGLAALSLAALLGCLVMYYIRVSRRKPQQIPLPMPETPTTRALASPIGNSSQISPVLPSLWVSICFVLIIFVGFFVFVSCLFLLCFSDHLIKTFSFSIFVVPSSSFLFIWVSFVCFLVVPLSNFFRCFSDSIISPFFSYIIYLYALSF